jgi:hypothetical protein
VRSSCLSCNTPLAPWTDKLDLGFNTPMTCFTATEQPSDMCATDSSILIETTSGWRTMETLDVGTETVKFGTVTSVAQKSQPACSYIFDSIEHGITDRDFARWCPDFAWDSQTIGGWDNLLKTMRADHANEAVMHNLLKGSAEMYAAASTVCDRFSECKSAGGDVASCIDTNFVSIGEDMAAYERDLGISDAASTVEHALAAIEKMAQEAASTRRLGEAEAATGSTEFPTGYTCAACAHGTISATYNARSCTTCANGRYAGAPGKAPKHVWCHRCVTDRPAAEP